jgi:hypothetical protein
MLGEGRKEWFRGAYFETHLVGEEGRSIGSLIVRHYRRDALLRVFGLHAG